MEQETKFAIEDKETANSIWEKALNGDFGHINDPETVVMKAVYFDTEDYILHKNHIALRARSEGNSCFATLKWGSKHDTENGLAIREEVNVPADKDTCFMAFPPEIFEQSIDGKKMLELIENKELKNLFETSVKRRRIKIEYNNSIVELSIDQGTVIGEKGECPISEIEIELYNGNVDDIIELSNKIADEYGLKPEPLSKYAKGIRLINE